MPPAYYIVISRCDDDSFSYCYALKEGFISAWPSPRLRFPVMMTFVLHHVYFVRLMSQRAAASCYASLQRIAHEARTCHTTHSSLIFFLPPGYKL